MIGFALKPLVVAVSVADVSVAGVSVVAVAAAVIAASNLLLGPVGGCLRMKERSPTFFGVGSLCLARFFGLGSASEKRCKNCIG